MSDHGDYKLKENVRTQHRRIVLWAMIWVVVWITLSNFTIVWIILNSNFDENIIGASNTGAFLFGFFFLPNLLAAIVPLLYLNSTGYRAKVPERIRKGVTRMYEREEALDGVGMDVAAHILLHSSGSRGHDWRTACRRCCTWRLRRSLDWRQGKRPLVLFSRPRTYCPRYGTSGPYRHARLG